MVTYEFYTGSYLGSAIPESAFSGVAARAEEILRRMKKTYQVRSTGEISEKLALCAMAEALYAHRGRKSGVRSAKMGEVSFAYDSEESCRRGLSRELYNRASVYLDIYRGVSL